MSLKKLEYRFREQGESWGSWVEIDPPILNGSETITGVQNGTTYEVQMRAENQNDQITESTIISVIPSLEGTENQFVITGATADANEISISYLFDFDTSLNKLEYSLNGGQSWTVANSETSPLVLSRGNTNPVFMVLRGNDTVLSKQTIQIRTYNAVQNGLRFTPPITSSTSGYYNVHGIQDDTSVSPPSLDDNDWEILNNGNPIVSHLDTIGKRKIDPVGFYMTNDNLSLFYNSGWDDYSDYRGGTPNFNRESTNQAGSLIAFDGSFNHVDFDTNPVLSNPQYAWQSLNRVNPYALVYHPVDECFYCWYGDFSAEGDGDRYFGRRSLGLAKSTDMVNWVYLSVDKPFFDIKDVYDIASQDFPNTNFNSQGRLYAFGATYVDSQIYLQVGGSIDGTNYTTMLRASSPFAVWSRVPHDNLEVARPMPIKIGNKWYSARNITSPSDPSERAMAIRVYDNLESEGVNHFIFDTGFTASAGVSRQLFYYNNKWHVAYRQSDSNDYRDMHIAREK